jgi:hypothetical protein
VIDHKQLTEQVMCPENSKTVENDEIKQQSHDAS